VVFGTAILKPTIRVIYLFFLSLVITFCPQRALYSFVPKILGHVWNRKGRYATNMTQWYGRDIPLTLGCTCLPGLYVTHVKEDGKSLGAVNSFRRPWFGKVWIVNVLHPGGHSHEVHHITGLPITELSDVAFRFLFYSCC
jgi:hypothetical protein